MFRTLARDIEGVLTVEQVADELSLLADTVLRAKPASAKGVYLKKISISSTMGPGIWVDPAEVQAALAV